MTPIISPWFIYFLSIVDGIKYVALAFAIVAGIAILVGAVRMSMGAGFGEDDSDLIGGRAILKKAILPFIVFLFLAILIPSRNIIIAMYVTKFVTTDNVTKAIEASGNFKDVIKKDIIEIIEAMKGEVTKTEE